MRRGKKTSGLSSTTTPDSQAQPKKVEWVKSDFESALDIKSKTRYLKAIYRCGKTEILMTKSEDPMAAACLYYGILTGDTVDVYRIGWETGELPVALRDELKYNFFFTKGDTENAIPIDTIRHPKLPRK